jgi:hypothetical protein
MTHLVYDSNNIRLNFLVLLLLCIKIVCVGCYYMSLYQQGV